MIPAPVPDPILDSNTPDTTQTDLPEHQTTRGSRAPLLHSTKPVDWRQAVFHRLNLWVPDSPGSRTQGETKKIIWIQGVVLANTIVL